MAALALFGAVMQALFDNQLLNRACSAFLNVGPVLGLLPPSYWGSKRCDVGAGLRAP